MCSYIYETNGSRHRFTGTVVILMLFIIAAGMVQSGHAQYKWEWLLPDPQGCELYAITYGKNRFVAVGPYGTVVTSDDGISWKSRPSGSTLDLRAIACNQTVFVALGRDIPTNTNSILYSEDAITWTPVNLHVGAASRFCAIAYGAGRFVAVGWNDLVLTSPDGTMWKLNKLEPSHLLTDVAFGNGLFVAVGNDNCMYTSTNGEAWQCALTDSIPYHQFVDFCNGRFYSVSGSGTVTSSTDGVTWSNQKVMALEAIRYIVYDHDYYLGVGTIGHFAISRDGITWEEWQAYSKNDQFNKTYLGADMYVAGGNGMFASVGEYGLISTSPDGTHWTRRTWGVGRSVSSAAYGNGGYVAVGWNGRLLTSPDGKAWSDTISDSTVHFNSVCRINDSFIALPTFDYEKLFDNPMYEDLSNGEYFVSPDGKTWSQRSVGPDKQVTRMIRANGLSVASCSDGSIVTSADGIEWIARTSPVNDTLRDVTFADSTFIAVGSRGAIVRSQDGIAWEKIPFDTLYHFYAVTYGNGTFVAVGTAGCIASSSDGKGWHMEQSGVKSTFTSIVYANDQFVVAGTFRVLVSPDGTAWSDCGFGYLLLLSSIIYADGYYIVTGASNGIGMMLRSPAEEYVKLHSPKKRPHGGSLNISRVNEMIVARFSGTIPSGYCSYILTDLSGRRVWAVETTVSKAMAGIAQPSVADGNYILSLHAGGATRTTCLPVIGDRP
jgi:hypothetical protein